MKKISLFMTAVFLSAVTMAQNDRVNFGLKAGVNLANLNVEDYDETEMKLGMYGGALAHIHITPNIGLQPEVVYSTQGAKDGDTKWLIDYVNVPIMLQYMFNNGFRIETGPQVGFLTRAKIEVDDEELDIKDDLKKTDISWGFGLNYLSTSGIGVGARYNLGLTDINEDDAGNKITNQVFQVGLFLMFDRAHKAKSQ